MTFDEIKNLTFFQIDILFDTHNKVLKKKQQQIKMQTRRHKKHLQVVYDVTSVLE